MAGSCPVMALAVCAILVWVLVEDLRQFRVRNVAVILLCLCFAIQQVLAGRSGSLLPHLLLAGTSLAILAGAFLTGAIGGGDAKLLTAAMLWVGPEGAVIFALALLVATGLYALGARLGLLPSRQLGAHTAIPFAPSIAVAWMATMALLTWD